MDNLFVVKLYSLVILSIIPTIIFSILTYSQDWFRNLSILNNDKFLCSLIVITVGSYLILLIRNYFNYCGKVEKIFMPLFILSISCLLGTYLTTVFKTPTPVVMCISIIITTVLLVFCIITFLIAEKRIQLLIAFIIILILDFLIHFSIVDTLKISEFLIILIFSLIFCIYFNITINRYYVAHVMNQDGNINGDMITKTIGDLFVQMYAPSCVILNEYHNNYYENYSSHQNNQNNQDNQNHQDNQSNQSNQNNQKKPKKKAYISDCQGFNVQKQTI